MKKKKYIAIVFMMVAICLALLSSETTFNNFKRTFFPAARSEEVIKIGVLQPLSGSFKQHGQAQLEGIQLANKMRPKLAGKKIELIEADSQGSVYVAESAIDDLIDKKPEVVIGSCGDAVTLTAAEKFEKAKIPAITATATNPLITENHKYYFRLSFSDDDQANVVANYILNDLKQEKVAVIRTEGDISASEMVRTFKNTFRAGLKSPAYDSIISIELAIKDNNYKSYIKKLKKENIKVAFAPISIVECEKVFEAAEKLDATDILFIGPESWHTKEMKALSEEFPKVKIMAAADLASNAKESNVYEDFIREFKKEYGKMPDEENARAFDAYMVVVDALDKTNGRGGEKFVKTMMKTVDFPAVTGEISFNSKGEAVKPINIDSLVNGKWKTVFTVDHLK